MREIDMAKCPECKGILDREGVYSSHSNKKICVTAVRCRNIGCKFAWPDYLFINREISKQELKGLTQKELKNMMVSVIFDEYFPVKIKKLN